MMTKLDQLPEIDKKDLELLQSQRLKIYDFKKIKISNLYLQIRSEWRWYSYNNIDSQILNPVTISDSFFVRFLKYYKEKKNFFGQLSQKKIKESEFFHMWDETNKVGYTRVWGHKNGEKIPHQISEKEIITKAKNFINLYNSIKKRGFRPKNLSKRHLIVSETPMENIFFGSNHIINGHEVWSGNHRAAVLCELGYEDIEAVFIKSMSKDL